MAKNQCDNCIFNDLYYNMFMQGDAIVVGEKVKEYCYVFDNGIATDILLNKKKCPYKKSS